jgi:hypothetical protein
MTIRFSDITGGGIPFGDNAGRPASPAIGKLYSNGEEKRLELYTSSGWQNIVSETPGVVSVSGNYLESSATSTLEITGTNFTTGAIASVVGTDGVEVNANSTTVNSIVSITAVFSGLSAAYEPYDLKVTNTSNLFGLLPDAFYVNQSPVWVTASGSLGTFNEQVSITLSALSATDPESTTIVYAIANGSSLPSGLSLNSSTGVISGTLPNIMVNTTYSFSITASDGLNTIPRSFSLSSIAEPTVFNYSSAAVQTLTIPSGVTSATFKIWGAGGGNAGSFAGGQGGYTTGTYTVVPGRVYNIYVGNTGIGRTGGWPGGGTASSGGNGLAAGGGGGYSAVQDSTNNVYLAIAGAGGGAISTTAGFNGGGETGVSTGNAGYGVNTGGTQSAGGVANVIIDGRSFDGGYLFGGNSSNPTNSGHAPGGGGGSGYYGGAGGASGGGAVTSGPGGSGYVNTSFTSNGTTIQGYGSDSLRGTAGAGGNAGKVVVIF